MPSRVDVPRQETKEGSSHKVRPSSERPRLMRRGSSPDARPDVPFRQKMSERMWKSEGLFAEAKQNHGLTRARYRARQKVQIQAYLSATAQNLKRLVFLFYSWLIFQWSRGHKTSFPPPARPFPGPEFLNTPDRILLKGVLFDSQRRTSRKRRNLDMNERTGGSSRDPASSRGLVSQRDDGLAQGTPRWSASRTVAFWHVSEQVWQKRDSPV